MRFRLIIEDMDWEDFKKLMLSDDLKSCNINSSRGLGFGGKVKKLPRAQNLSVRMHE